MKFVLFLLPALAFAQSITLTSTDTRCSGAPLTCTFIQIGEATAPVTQPADYGVPITATLSGGGTWTIGSESPSTCNSALFAWWGSTAPPTTPASISTISSSGTIYISPNNGVAGNCNPSTYTHTVTLTNSISGTYTITLVQRVIYRMAAPIYLNGFGVTDASLSGSGFTQQTPAGNTFTFDLNKVPCANCRPGGTFNMPAPGSTFTDNLGNTNTVITPVGFVAPSDTEKAELSVNNLWIVVQSLGSATYGTGNWFLFPVAGAATPSYSFTGNDLCNSTWAWSNVDDLNLYCFSEPAFASGANTSFKHVVLGTPPAYTSTVEYSMPYATYGRAFSTNFSHQDMNKLNWYAMNTYFDYSGQVSTSGTALTWVSGQVFDTTKFLDQFIATPGGTFQIASCASTTACTLYTSGGTQTNVAATAQVPWKLCGFNPVLITAQGSGYTPTCGDLTTMPRPHISSTFGAAAYISHDTVGGLLYMVLGVQPYNVIGTFDPNTPTTVTLSRPWLNDAPDSGYQFGTNCTAALSGNSGVLALNANGYCQGQAHSTGFSVSDGSQWFLNGVNGAQFDSFKMSSAGSPMTPYSLNNGTGNFLSTLWTQFQGGEYSGSRKSPYMLASTGLTTIPTSWNVTNCTNANPIVVTVSTASDTGINNSTHNKVLIGGVLGNTACNGSKTVASVASSSGSLHDIWTLTSGAGSGTYTSATGDATEDVAISTIGNGDVNQMYLLRDLGQELRRFGNTRGVLYNDRCQSSFYAVSRASLSMDAKYAVYTTNNGIPGCSEQVVLATTGVSSGIGMTSNLFDGTHGVTAATISGGTATLAYSTPDTGNAIVDVCQTLRFPDVPGGSSPDGTCQTATNSSGANPRTTTFTVAAGSWFYQIDANNKWTAWGTFTAPGTFGTQTTGGARVSGNATIH